MCDEAMPPAQETKDNALEMLGFRYAEVLRDNLNAKFDVETTPFDETAFFEASHHL